MSTIKISPVVPQEHVVQPLTSTSKHILRRRIEEVPPLTSATDYAYGSNSRLEFLLNSASDFVDFQHSFIRFSVACVLNDGGDVPEKAFASGGAHSFFSEIRVETSNGVVIQRISNYNKWYAMMSQSLGKEYIESVGQAWGDSMGSEADYAGLGGASTQGAREYCANNTSTLCFQPALPLLMMGQDIPLAIIRGGLRVILELADPSQVLSAATGDIIEGSVATATVTLSNPRYLVSYVQPSQEVIQAYLTQFNSSGVSYTYPDVQLYQNQLAVATTGLAAFQHHANVRSARCVYTIQQNDNMATTKDVSQYNSSYAVDSCGTFLKMNLKEYQYYSGALRFPTSTPVDMTDEVHAEALQYYLQCRGIQGIESSIRPHPDEWMERDTIDNVTDSSKLIIAAKLGRGNDAYSGLDLSLQPLTTELNYDAAYTVGTNKNIFTWIEADVTLTIGADGVVVRK